MFYQVVDLLLLGKGSEKIIHLQFLSKKKKDFHFCNYHVINSFHYIFKREKNPSLQFFTISEMF